MRRQPRLVVPTDSLELEGCEGEQRAGKEVGYGRVTVSRLAWSLNQLHPLTVSVVFEYLSLPLHTERYFLGNDWNAGVLGHSQANRNNWRD